MREETIVNKDIAYYITLLKRRGVYIDPADIESIDPKALWEQTETLLKGGKLDDDLIKQLAKYCGVDPNPQEVLQHISLCEQERKAFLQELEKTIQNRSKPSEGPKLDLPVDENIFIDKSRRIVHGKWDDPVVRQQLYEIMSVIFSYWKSPICARKEGDKFSCELYCQEDMIKRCATFALSRMMDNDFVIHKPGEPYQHGKTEDGKPVWFCCGMPMYSHVVDFNIIYICSRCQNVLRLPMEVLKNADNSG